MRAPYIDSSDLGRLRALGLPGTGSGMRASDAERERAAEALRRHHADGRLTTEEFEERTERAYAAKTLGDLDRLFADLPRLRTVQEERPLRAWPSSIGLRIALVFLAIALLASVHFVWIVWLLMIFLFFRLARRGHWSHSRGWPQTRGRY